MKQTRTSVLKCILAGVVFAGCGPRDNPLDVEQSFEGRYELVAVGGDEVPGEVLWDAGGPDVLVTMHSGFLTLAEDATFEVSLNLTTESKNQLTLRFSGFWQQTDARTFALIHGDFRPIDYGVLDGDDLEVDLSGNLLRFLRG